MARSPEEILEPARSEVARGRPRAALRELESARAELVAASDADGLAAVLEIARGIKVLAAVDRKSRERLIEAAEQDVERLGSAVSTAFPQALEISPVEEILAPARAEIERGNSQKAMRRLEKARQRLFAQGDVDGLVELVEMTRRLPATKPRHQARRVRLIDAARQNVRFLTRRNAIWQGREWTDPYSTGAPTRKLPSLPPMSRRDKLIAVGIVLALAAGAAIWIIASRAPQRVAHAIQCPSGRRGSPTWSPDGEEIAYADNGSCGTQIMVVAADGRSEPYELTEGYGVLPDWSPDGEKILYRSKDGFSVIDVVTDETELIKEDDGAMGATWSPDGKRIAFVHGLEPDVEYDEGFESTLYTMDANGSDVQRLVGHECNPRTPEWTPGGDHLVFACDDGIYDLPAKGGKASQFIVSDFDVWPVSVSIEPVKADSIVYGWAGIEVFSFEKGDDPDVLADVLNWDMGRIDVAYSPDGEQIAYSVVGSGTEDGLWVIDKNGKNPRYLASF